jgi:hypothetical protein
MLPLAPVKAIAPGTLSSFSVQYDDTILVDGTGVTAGATVEVYWDAVQPWDGEAGKLNSSKAKASGSWDLEIDIPEALIGPHYIWARDISTGDTIVFPMVTMNPSLDFDPSSGLPNDDIDVSGYGFGEELEITDFEWWNATLGDWVPLALTPSTPETDELGTWTGSFDVPSNFPYGTVDVQAIDEDVNTGTEPFTTGASITLDIDEGPEGSLVEVKGRGFSNGGIITTGAITLNGVPCTVLEDDTIGAGPKYEFTVEIIIPSIGEGEWTLVATDGVNSPSDTFEIQEDGEASVTVEPTFGVQGSTVAISGSNFSRVDEGEVIVELWDGGFVTDIDEFETDSDGEFSGTFQVPAQSNGLYSIYAYQPDYGVEDMTDFKIGSVIVILNKVEGPSGMEVVLTGTGFEFGPADWNATFGDETVIDEDAETDADGNLEVNGQVPKFWVPSLPPGVYEITVMDEEGTTVTVDFELTETTMVETDPLVAPAGEGSSGDGYNVTIIGKYFSQDDTADLEFVLWNETDDWEMVVRQGDPGTTDVEVVNEEDEGEFEAWWEVDTELSIGTYWMNVTDANDMFAQYVLELVPKTVEIDPRKSTFRIGDTVAFTIEHSFSAPDSFIKIWDPTGDLYWQTDAFMEDLWIKVGSIERLPYFAQVAGGNPMTLLDDAPLGTWEWTWYDEGGDDELDSGSFEVIEAESDVLGQQVADLGNQLTDLQESVADVTSEFDDIRSQISDVAAIAEQAVTAANQATEAVQTVAQTANQANTAAENAATAAEAARDAANGLTTLVYGAIGAALVAALAAIVSLMQISRRIAG